MRDDTYAHLTLLSPEQWQGRVGTRRSSASVSGQLTPLNLSDARRIVKRLSDTSPQRLHNGIDYVTPQTRLEGLDGELLAERRRKPAAARIEPDRRRVASCSSRPAAHSGCPLSEQPIVHFALNHYTNRSQTVHRGQTRNALQALARYESQVRISQPVSLVVRYTGSRRTAFRKSLAPGEPVYGE